MLKVDAHLQNWAQQCASLVLGRQSSWLGGAIVDMTTSSVPESCPGPSAAAEQVGPRRATTPGLECAGTSAAGRTPRHLALGQG